MILRARTGTRRSGMATTHVSIKKHFARLKDPRINRRKRHLLIDIVVIAICAVICGADSWPQVALFGQKRLDWLKTFLSLDRKSTRLNSSHQIISYAVF